MVNNTSLYLKMVDNTSLYLKIVDYYYDNIHWESDLSINEWLTKEYGARYNIYSKTFSFESDASKAWFLLRFT
jgi:hypothetical protein